ncbi:choline-sulfatase [Martelella lutilitoris]|uniref:Choline-sulfatase n=1 Tax=Martelella lutilitoris TaxID=2583532 RepID=A0A7T7KM69_9HYPH|nr:choline-sulfatase [Martelella lutilitoris]QQM30619.1 choline-sulfatase [Martelella lutilitoris]
MTARPNILVLMVDQLAGTLFPDGPADFLHTPNLKKLADRSTRFQNAYTGSPLCAPARASFMSGQLPRRTRVYDNAAEFSPDIVTYAHHLRRAGYQTSLAGKMHFVGPDQLHGFEERLTTDVYPADYGWTPDYGKPGERIDWWYHNMGSVTGAGIGEITNQLEYDDEVAYEAVRKVYDLGRRKDDRPFMLTVSFTHPHDPYVARKKYWDLYEDCDHLEPEVGPIDYAAQDGHSKRIFDANDFRSFDITKEDIRRARRAYFANVSYIDDKIGEILEALDGVGLSEDTVIVFLSDHGDMLGERGLWFKMSFYEGSSRVPLMIAAPGMEPGLVRTPASTVDIAATLADLARVDMASVAPWTDGESLVPVAAGQERKMPVRMEYAAEASEAPLVSIREGRFKYNHCELDAPQLFDLEADPHELTNLADDPAHAETAAAFAAKVREYWDMAAYDAEIRESQARRHIVYEALRQGDYHPWDHQPMKDASERFMRNHMDLNILEASQRWPRGE